MANSKRTLFLKRRLRVRNKLRKVNAGRPRLSVHRSNKNISVQLIDDVRGVTLASASTLEKDLGVVGKNNVEAATKVAWRLPSGPRRPASKRPISIVVASSTTARSRRLRMPPVRVA